VHDVVLRPYTDRILLVDDDRRNLLALEAILEPLEATLIRALDGRSALEEIAREPPQLVILDVRMPGIDGIEVLQRMRAAEEGVHVPVILVTAASERQDRVRGLEAGADEFLEKPIDPPVLMARVRSLLGLRRASQLLSEKHGQLVRLQAEQRELMACLVHDLKNPLAIADLNLQHVRCRVESPALRECLDDSLLALDRLRHMVTDLLSISKMERPGGLVRTSVTLRPLLQDVARAHAREADEKGIEVLVRASDATAVHADAGVLRRMIENVVENAIRHTPSAGRVALSAEDGDRVEVAIANTGDPIPAPQRVRIFGAYERGERRANDEGAGNVGLGLYFCRRAAEAHGGDIEVRESPEWPTSFVIRLPRASMMQHA
jgi:two-component system, sensor histidine kinase and response regulator